MTREEAIKTLRKIQREVIRGTYVDKVYDMAIEALSEKTSTIQEKHQLSEETPTNTPTKSTNISNPPICPDCGSDMRGEDE